MLKVTSAPTLPVPVCHGFYVTGMTDPGLAGKSLIVAIENQLKFVGPPVGTDGNWRVDLVLQQPGDHKITLSLEREAIDVVVTAIDRSKPAAVPVPPPPGKDGKDLTLPISSIPTGVPTLEALVQEAFTKRFSDVHLCVGKTPRFRNQGVIEVTTYPEVTDAIFFGWLREVLPETEIQSFKETMDYDGAAQYDFARVRINVFETLKGPAMVLRLIPMKVPTLDELELPPVFQDICHHQKGLVLITGPTGSGKSTTLAAMINYINGELPRHVVTIEDPIEFVHKDNRCVISQREVGIHTQEFDRALKASLREDPDIILIGEMRDRETMNTALKAAQTGHLVLGTLHTNSAVKSIERILNLFNPEEQEIMRIQVAESLVAIVAQTLVPTTDGKRALSLEIMINTDTIRDYIKRGDVDETENQVRDGGYYGMCSMNQSLYRLYEAGRITEETALEASLRPNEMAILLRGGSI